MAEELITLDGLGLDVVGGRLRARPSVPERLSPLTLRGIHVRGKEVDA